MGHTRRLFVSGSFAVLEAAAVELLRALKSTGDSLAPLWVIVPTNLLRLHLARQVAASGPGHANLRFLTLLDLARELAETSLLAGGARPLSDLAATALVRRLVVRHGGGYFRELAERPGLHSSLLATFGDLADAEVDPELLGEFARAAAPSAAGAEKLETLAELYRCYREELTRLRLYDRNDLLLAAARRAPEQPPPGGQVILYGFYDFTPRQRTLVAAVTDQASAVVFVPWEDGPRFPYATQTVSWLRSRGFAMSESLGLPDAASDLARGQSRLFESREGEGSPAALSQPDGSVVVVSAPGETREAREVVRAVLRLVRERGLHFHEIGVLLRTREPYVALIAEALDHAGVPVYREGGRPLLETRAGRSLRLLLRCVQEDFARATVIDFLTTAPIPFATLLTDGARCSPAQWDVLSGEAGIVAALPQWGERLAALHRRYEAQRREQEEPPPWLEARLAEIDRCARFLARWGADLAAIPRRGSWREIVDACLRAFVAYVERSEEAERVRDAVAPLAQLDAVADETTLAEVVTAVTQALESAHESAGAFGRGVFVGEVMSARGLSFRATVLPGLVERVVPRPVSEDPLLLDEERVYLGERTGRQMAEKQRGFEEERLLFTLMLRSAREAVVLTFPRLDMATARDRLPSFYLLHLFTAITGRHASYRELEEWSCLQRVELSRLFPPSREQAVDALEVHLADADEAIESNAIAPLSALLSGAPFLRPACRAEEARAHPAFTVYDGVLEAPAARARLQAREWTLSTHRVQTYLRCPYRFFLEQLLGIEQLDTPEQVQTLSPLDRGNLVHGILHEFYERARAGGLVPLAAAERERAVALMDEVAAARCREFEAEGLPGLPLLWRRERRRLRETLHRFLTVEIERADGLVPSHGEFAFGDEGREVCVALAGGEIVRLRGRIDRIDLGPDRVGLVLDYKTGKPAEVSSDAIDPDTLQLPFYLHAVRQLFPETRWRRAELYYVGPRSRFERVGLDASAPAAQEAALAELLAEVLAGIRGGWFPAGRPSCGYCQYTPVCGRAAELYAVKQGGLGRA